MAGREEKKKIVIYGTVCSKSTGFGKIILNMAKLFKKAGHEVITIGYDYNNHSIHHEGIPIVPGFHCPNCGNNFLGSPEMVQKLTLFLETHPPVPDFFICVADPNSIQIRGIGTIKFEDIKQIKTIMYGALDSIGVFTDTMLKQAGLPDFVPKCDRLVSMAKHTQNEFKEWMDLDSKLIYPAIDTNNYHPVDKDKRTEIRKKYRFKEDDFIIYSAGRNITRKRHNILLEAVVRFLCETENTYLYLNIPFNMKDGASFYTDISNPIDFIKRVMKKKYGRDFIDEGRIAFVSRGDLGSTVIGEREHAEIYQISDLYATTTGGEGLGLMVLEAESCEIPVIVPENTTGPEVVGELNNDGPPMDGYREGKGGLLLKCPSEVYVGHNLKQYHTTQDITYNAIKYMYGHPEERIEMGKRGREHVLQNFNQTKFEKQWLNVIKETKKKEIPKESDFKTMEVEEKKKDEKPSKEEK